MQHKQRQGVTRRGFLAGTAAAGLAVRTGHAEQAQEASVAKFEPLEAPVLDGRPAIVDLHTHPTLKSYMFHTQFWRPHNPPGGFFPLAMRLDIDALIAGGVSSFLCTVYVVERQMFDDVWPLGLLAKAHPRAKHIATAPMDELTRAYLDEAEAMVKKTRERRGDVIEIATSFPDIQRINAAGKVCMLHAVEGAHHLNGDIGMVDELYERGVCQMIVPHLYPNKAGGCVDLFSENVSGQFPLGVFSKKYQDDSGMTPWGRDLVEKLLDVGILIDPTHGTSEYRKQMLEMARLNSKKRPVIMSHIGVHALWPSAMSPTPEDIKEIADTGGVIGIIMMGRGNNMTGVEYVLANVEHLVQHGGEECVAIGSDFDGFTHPAKDLKSPRDFEPMRQALLAKYSEAQVAKFLGGNATRVLKDGWGKQA